MQTPPTTGTSTRDIPDGPGLTLLRIGAWRTCVVAQQGPPGASQDYASRDVPLRQRKGAFSLLGGEPAVRDSGALGASPGSGGRKGAAR